MPFLVAAALAVAAAWNFFGLVAALAPAAALVFFYFVFKDPHRPVPAVPLGVVSPVDGEVLEVGLTEQSTLGVEAQTITLSVNVFGTYTARSPIEGKIMDIANDVPDKGTRIGSGGMWVRTDEKDDVVLRFQGHRFGLAPKAFIRYGERVGQGQRCAFLRLTRIAVIEVPVVARMQVKPGQRVTAGSDVLAKLPHH